MDEIAMAAEITKPTVYLYFKSKDDLLPALAQPLMDAKFANPNRKFVNWSNGRQDGPQTCSAAYLWHATHLFPPLIAPLPFSQRQPHYIIDHYRIPAAVLILAYDLRFRQSEKRKDR
jgi:AcrR family transcriptional regulator